MEQHKISGRAYSAEEKRAIVERILKVWQHESMSSQRLGQLIMNAARFTGQGDLFYREDDKLALATELFLADHAE